MAIGNYLIFHLSLWLGLLSWSVFAVGQDTPLLIRGAFEDATVLGKDYNAGGVIVVNGFTMNIPENLHVQFPKVWVPWRDFVASKEDFVGFETRASDIIHPPETTCSANVTGNSINGEPQVAQVQIHEFFQSRATGFVESIDYTAGTMQIQNGPVVRINDPNGVFSVGYTGALFMAVDDVSPSITSLSGFPMCIPRKDNDPLCPLSNRPFNGPGNFTAPDPLVMAPFLPGDFITFNGFRRGNEVIATSIVAENVQILTLDDLVYIRMDIGVLGIYNPNPALEIQDSNFVGFTSNSNATVALYAMDTDPCTGEITDRIIATMILSGGDNYENIFEFDSDIFENYTREYRIVAEIDGVPKTRETKNGLVAGEYIQTITEYVQAVQDEPGVPPVPYDFSQIQHLTQGVGWDSDGNMWGPLRPFPQSGVVIEAPVCSRPTEGGEAPVGGTDSVGGSGWIDLLIGSIFGP